ncbi:hypothetical protein H0H81_009350 [Sphagnurus paluster]|uniref:SET domain-containing protein n=1 Tax=Sphagnurus paluster TaxID=117069 RepID=A0A9P7FWD4_9AGAR|nr:hypothetical protein H0H81_009350 [Sphagnurus paluster]
MSDDPLMRIGTNSSIDWNHTSLNPVAHAEARIAKIEALAWQKLQQYSLYLSMVKTSIVAKHSAKHRWYHDRHEACMASRNIDWLYALRTSRSNLSVLPYQRPAPDTMKRGFLNTPAPEGSELLRLPKPKRLQQQEKALPENCEPSEPYRTVGQDETGYDDKYIYMTTLPPRKFGETLADNPDNWTQCLFSFPEQESEIVSTAGFPSPLVRPPQLRHRVGPSRFGNRLFAACHVQMKQLIKSGRPLLICPVRVPIEPNLSKCREVTFEQLMQEYMDDYEELLKVFVDRMEPENQTAFFKLQNSHTEDGSRPIFGRIRTNRINILSDTSAEQKAAGNLRGCTPNIALILSSKSLSIQVRAVRDIKKEEELFMSYCKIDDPTAMRQKQLESHGFQCTCRVCSDPDTDVLLELIRVNNLTEGGHDRYLEFGVTNLMEHAEEWLAVIEALGWQRLKEYGRYLLTAMAAAMRSKDSAGFNRYQAIQEAWTEGIYEESTIVPVLSEMKALLDAPRE